MSVLNDNSPVYERTRDLCVSIIQDQEIQQLKESIDAFLSDTDARSLFENVNKMGEELREKQMSGIDPTEEEISRFDELRQNVVTNPVCHEFLQARQQIDTIFNEINRYFGMTLELNRVPSHEEVMEAMAPKGGCCGGGCGDDGCDDGCGDDCSCK